MLRFDKVGPEKFPAPQITLLPVEHDPFAPPGLERFDPDQPETAAAPAAQAPPKKPFGLMDTWPARLAKAAWECTGASFSSTASWRQPPVPLGRLTRRNPKRATFTPGGG